MALLLGIAALVAGLVSAGDQLSSRIALALGSTLEVAGRVEDFRPAPFKGRESFSVAGVPFAYSPEISELGYHQAARDGGPIHPSAMLRLKYIHRRATVADSFGNVILQVEALR
jgi:hypothetical protein